METSRVLIPSIETGTAQYPCMSVLALPLTFTVAESLRIKTADPPWCPELPRDAYISNSHTCAIRSAALLLCSVHFTSCTSSTSHPEAFALRNMAATFLVSARPRAFHVVIVGPSLFGRLVIVVGLVQVQVHARLTVTAYAALRAVRTRAVNAERVHSLLVAEGARFAEPHATAFTC